GCEIDPPGNHSGIELALCSASSTSTRAGTILIENSWLHDTGEPFQPLSPVTYVLTGDSFLGTAYVIDVNAGVLAQTTVVNSLFANNAGLSTEAPSVHHHNAFFSTGGDFGASPGDVTTNPLLDTTSSPPSLMPGSPCKGAADPATSSDHDYWGL